MLDRQSAQFTACSFFDNEAVVGGAIYTDTFVETSSCEFRANTATSHGGAVFAQKSLTFGFDAQSESYTDLVKAGIIDPTKVVRIALQDAASVAGLLITTEAMVAEKPEKNAPAPAMPDMGGMGGMGGMGM